jgi:hypothetical protein
LTLRVVFVEPPKEYWFVMGEYLPPPTACLQLAAYLESKHPEHEITVVDCQAENLDWSGLERRIASLKPNVVAVSSLSTCNTYTVARAMETAKRAVPDTLTITGGQHFTALAEPSLREYPEIDAIARGQPPYARLPLRREPPRQVQLQFDGWGEALRHNRGEQRLRTRMYILQPVRILGAQMADEVWEAHRG